jgi:hypothetical protein
VGIGRVGVGLRYLLRTAFRERVDRHDQQRRAFRRQIAFDLVARVVRSDSRATPRRASGRVERLDHTHDRDASLGVAGDNRAVHGRGSAVPG